MNNMEKIEKMLANHLDPECENQYTDHDLIEKVKELVTKYNESQKAKVTEDAAEPAPPSNVYQVLMGRMTPQQLATLGVQLVQVNGSELFWMTSVGQLYAFNNKQAALEAEYSWLMSKPN